MRSPLQHSLTTNLLNRVLRQQSQTPREVRKRQLRQMLLSLVNIHARPHSFSAFITLYFNPSMVEVCSSSSVMAFIREISVLGTHPNDRTYRHCIALISTSVALSSAICPVRRWSSNKTRSRPRHSAHCWKCTEREIVCASTLQIHFPG